MRLWICEKPDQARNIAAEIGVVNKTKECIETKDGIFTWGFGHLLEALPPQEYDAKFARWVFEDLPCVPAEFRYVPRERAGAQLKAIGTLLKRATEVVVATDPDREGEMIGREILTHFRWKGPVQRLWLSALDSGSIRKALASLKPGRETEALYWAAKARSEADWLVGMNLTRAATLTTTRAKGAGVVSIGRVQTPTLALIVRRDRAIANFEVTNYFELEGSFECQGSLLVMVHSPSEKARCLNANEAKQWSEECRAVQLAKLERKDEEKHQAPPALFTLSTLQKRANAAWGWSADKTLAIAQSLYETHKATTYPRSDCPYLPEDQIADVPKIIEHLVALRPFSHLAGSKFQPRKGSVFNTAKITAHHAIIPTGLPVPWSAMKEDERAAYVLIAAHYIAAMLPDYRYHALRYSTMLAGRAFVATGATPIYAGWKAAFSSLAEERNEEEGGKDSKEGGANTRLPDLPDAAQLKITGMDILAKKTKPLAAYTEGTLVEDMENVAKHVTDPAKRARLKETSGIGTQATRAAIIETLKARKFIETKGRKIISTGDGRALVERLERIAPALVDPGETAVWEDKLEEVAEGKTVPDVFVREVGATVRGLLSAFEASAAPSSLIHGAVNLPPAGPTGIPGVIDRGEWFEHEKVRSRLYKSQWGHVFTADEIARLVDGEAITLTDCKSKAGASIGPKRVTFNPKGKPYPCLVFADAGDSPGGAGSGSSMPTSPTGGSSSAGGGGGGTVKQKPPSSLFGGGGTSKGSSMLPSVGGSGGVRRKLF